MMSQPAATFAFIAIVAVVAIIQCLIAHGLCIVVDYFAGRD